MLRHGWLVICLLIGTGSIARCADERLPANSPESTAINRPAGAYGRGTVPTPLQDDAALHDVQFVGTQTGWAVGDHGVIWKTSDGGMNWELQASNVKCALRSACFLTDKIGWIVGGESLPYVHQGQGVILATENGGTQWKQIGGPDLPEFQRVKFFTLTHGVAAGEPNPQCTSGISVTIDGGKTWKSAPGESAASWRAADFLSPELGAVAGLRGEHSLFGNGQLVKSKLGRFGLRGLYGLKLMAGGEGWLVGDGGLILHQARGGIVWESPENSPPREVRELFDFRAVTVRGPHVWVAGNPGSVIWHSPDGGRKWESQTTRQTLPIAALCFPSEDVGWAVGALGTILQSDDGGETWLPVRGGGRRMAYLAAHSHVDKVSIPLVTAVSGEAGFRGLVTVVPRYDIGNSNVETRELDLKLAEANMLAGGSVATINWRLPVDIPGLEDNPERLIEEWTKRSEGAFHDQFVAQFVRQLRTWRPSVVIVDEPGPREALVQLIRDTMLEAIPLAADPGSQPAQQDLADLPPWQVERIFVRLANGSQGHVNLGAFDMLSRQGCAVQMAAAPALSRLRTDVVAQTSREAYRVVSLDGQPAEYKGQDFFAKLGISPDTAARRALPLIEDAQHARKLQLAQQQRNFQESLKRLLTDSRQASQLLGQLADVTRGMPNDQGALMLAQLADTYRRRGQWDMAEAILVEMVDRYPHEPAAQDAMRWLVQFWVGGELTYQRLRSTNIQHQKLSVDMVELNKRLQNSGQRRPTDEGTIADEIEQVGGSKASLKVEQIPTKIGIGSSKELRQEQINLWQDKARRMAALLQRTAPAWYHSPEIQMPLAALFRQRQLATDANECYHFVMHGGDQSPWQKSAATELWLNQMAGVPPKSIYGCRAVSQSPVLDGLLNDECWQGAEEMPLTSDQADGPLRAQAFALICHDQEFLYFAGVCPRVPGTPTDLPERTGRTYDPDLGDHDRVTLMLDVDRDYVTYYRFTIDQRGWTNEDLWGDVTWNPKWYVSADGDEGGWRFEVAIPWKELVKTAPAKDTVWAASVVRHVPAHGLQSWTKPVLSRQKMETGGLLKIE